MEDRHDKSTSSSPKLHLERPGESKAKRLVGLGNCFGRLVPFIPEATELYGYVWPDRNVKQIFGWGEMVHADSGASRRAIFCEY